MHPRVRLGRSPVEVVPLGVGCWAWGDREYWRYEEDHGPREVIDADDRIDTLQDEVVRALIARIGQEPENAPQAVDLILVAESLERVADHATNIAEDVILIAEARNVKHAGKLAAGV